MKLSSLLQTIERCRTAALGGHLDACSDCGTGVGFGVRAASVYYGEFVLLAIALASLLNGSES